MAFPVPFGQYIPAQSIVHSLDARVKIVLLIAYAIGLFVSSTWIGLGLCGVILVASYLIAKVPLTYALKGMRPIFYILVITLVFNMFTFNAGTGNADADPHAIVFVGTFGFSPQGLIRGLYFSARIVFLTAGASLLTFTTTLLSLTDAAGFLLRPLRVFRVPVEDVAMVFSITLRFIPLTVEEAEKIKTAQMARGVKFDEGGLIVRAKAWIPVITPLFINLFRRADDLAFAMDSRCYTSEGRTHRREAKITGRDIAIGIALTAMFIAIGIFG